MPVQFLLQVACMQAPATLLQLAAAPVPCQYLPLWVCCQVPQSYLLGIHAQVYVTVYADGPTRVLQFSDVPNLGNLEADLSILDLAARLKQVCPWPPAQMPRPDMSLF